MPNVFSPSSLVHPSSLSLPFNAWNAYPPQPSNFIMTSTNQPRLTGAQVGVNTGYPHATSSVTLSTPSRQHVSLSSDFDFQFRNCQSGGLPRSISNVQQDILLPEVSQKQSAPFKASLDVMRDYCLFRLQMESQPRARLIRQESVSFLRGRCPEQSVRDDCRTYEKWYRNKRKHVSEEEIAKYPPAEWTYKSSRRQQVAIGDAGKACTASDQVRANLSTAFKFCASESEANCCSDLVPAVQDAHSGVPDDGGVATLASAGTENGASSGHAHSASCAELEPESAPVGVEGDAAPGPPCVAEALQDIVPALIPAVADALPAVTVRRVQFHDSVQKLRMSETCRNQPDMKEVMRTLDAVAPRIIAAGYDNVLKYLGQGTFGTVVGLCREGKVVTALKIARRDCRMIKIVEGNFGGEAAAMYLSHGARGPFMPPGVVGLFGDSCLGAVATAVRGGTPRYTAILAMQAGHTSGRTMMKHLNGFFQDIDGNVTAEGWEQLWAFFGSLLDALAILHETGIAHRDIKPDNMVIGQSTFGRIGCLDDSGKPAMVYLIDYGGSMFSNVAYTKSVQASTRAREIST